MTSIYTVLVTVEVSADSQHEAYQHIRRALDKAKTAAIVLIDSEVTDERPDEDADPVTAPKLTRQEKLQALADHGCDTWEEYRGER